MATIEVTRTFIVVSLVDLARCFVSIKRGQRDPSRSSAPVQAAADDGRHDLLLAVGERCVGSLELAEARRAAVLRPAAVDGDLDRTEQRIGVHGLRQELHGATFHGAHGHGHVAMAGDEDDRHLGATGDERLQVEATEVRQADIEHQAARRACTWPREEVLRRPEGLLLIEEGLPEFISASRVWKPRFIAARVNCWR